MKIFTLSNQNQHIDYPKPSHHLRKIHISSNWKSSNYPVGVRPSSRRPHPKNAKLFLSIYRLCRASAGFIRPHPSLIPASPILFSLSRSWTLKVPQQALKVQLPFFPFSSFSPNRATQIHSKSWICVRVCVCFSFIFKGFPVLFVFFSAFLRASWGSFKEIFRFPFRAFWKEEKRREKGRMKIVEFSKARKPTVIREAQRQKQRQRKNQLPL